MRFSSIFCLLMGVALLSPAQQTIEGVSPVGPLRMGGAEPGPEPVPKPTAYLSLSWVKPVSAGTTANVAQRLEVKASSTSPLDASSFRVFVNDVEWTNSKFGEVNFNAVNYTYNNAVNLRLGENRIYVTAANAAGQARTPTLVITHTPPKPTLHVLAFGPKYFDLQFPATDAADFAALWNGQAGDGRLYKEVKVTRITHESASRDAIVNAVEDLRIGYLTDNASADDVYLIFFSGHGIVDNGQLFLQPYGSETGRYVSSYVKMDDLKSILNQFPGKKIVFIDACRTVSSGAKSPSADLLVAELQRLHQATGLQIFASCKLGQSSFEHPNWQNGAFTEVLIKGLKGAADADNNKIVTLAELQRYLIRETPLLTTGVGKPAQNPEVLFSLDADIPLYIRP